MLPNEILLSIIEIVESNKDLLVLARVSRVFNILSIRVCFKRYDLNTKSTSLSLKNHPNGLILFALCISVEMVGRAFEEVTYHYAHCDEVLLTFELHLLARFFLRLSSVIRVNLRFHCPHSDNFPLLHDAAIREVLDATLSKGCSYLHVETDSLFATTSQENLLIWPTSPTTESQNQFGEEEEQDDGSNEIALQSCSIQTFPPFLRPFYFDVLHANPQVLTELNFGSILCFSSDFSTLISSLRLPKLKHFGFQYVCVIPEVMFKFFLDHQHLESLEYHHIRYTSASPWDSGPARRVPCTQLHRMIVSPMSLLHMLPSVLRMPRLEFITILVEDDANLEEALWSLSDWEQSATLTLRFSIEFRNWLRTMMSGHTPLDPAEWPEAFLLTVETLVVDIGAWDLTTEIIDLIPPWVTLFPVLKELKLQTTSESAALAVQLVSPVDTSLADTFSENLKGRCPFLQKVSIILGAVKWDLFLR